MNLSLFAGDGLAVLPRSAAAPAQMRTDEGGQVITSARIGRAHGHLPRRPLGAGRTSSRARNARALAHGPLGCALKPKAQWPERTPPGEGPYKGPVAPPPAAFTFIPYGCTKLRVVALLIVS